MTAVTIKCGFKSFGWSANEHVVLNNINISVEKGTM